MVFTLFLTGKILSKADKFSTMNSVRLPSTRAKGTLLRDADHESIKKKKTHQLSTIVPSPRRGLDSVYKQKS